MPTKHLIPVEGHPHLARDPVSGAILAINKTEIEQARERKKIRKKQAQENDQLRRDVDHLRDEISELKRLILQLVER